MGKLAKIVESHKQEVMEKAAYQAVLHLFYNCVIEEIDTIELRALRDMINAELEYRS